MEYFSLSKYLMDTIDFNKHDIDIFINDTWQKYVGDSSKLQGDMNFNFDQGESEVNLHKAISSPPNMSPVSLPFFSNCTKQTHLNLFRTSEHRKILKGLVYLPIFSIDSTATENGGQ